MTIEDQRRFLISDWINGSYSITELAHRYQIMPNPVNLTARSGSI